MSNKTLVSMIYKWMSVFFLLTSVVGCISIDPRFWSEKVDVEYSKDFTGVYSARPSYASSEPELIHGDLYGDLLFSYLGFPQGKPDKVRIHQSKTGDLTFVWEIESKEIGRDVMSTNKKWKRLEDGSFILDPEGSMLPTGGGDPALFGYNKHTIRFFRNVDGNLVVKRSDNAGGAFLIMPVVIVSRKIKIYPLRPK